MASIANELQNLPLEYVIAAPMQGVIKASELAANTTLEFIEKIGFNDEDGVKSVKLVEFLQRQNDSESSLSVPLLSMVPVPYIRIKDMKINFDFQIKTTEVVKDTRSSNKTIKGKAGWSWGALSISAKGNYRSANEKTTQTDKSANLKVEVNVVQDEIPGGLQKLLNILENSIVPINNSGNQTIKSKKQVDLD